MIPKLKSIFIICIFSFFIYSSSANSSFFNLNNSSVVSDYISNYLKGSVLINQNQYSEANIYFSKIKKLSNTHPSYNFQYIFSLVMSGKIAEANSIITSLDKQYRDNDLFQLIEGVFLIKNRNFYLAKEKFKNSGNSSPLFIELNNYINLWLEAENSPEQELKIKKIKTIFSNIKLIQSFLIYDYVGNDNLYKKTSLEILKQPDLGRYHFFHSIFLIKKNKIQEATKIIENQLLENPNNLLMKQSYVSLKNNNLSFFTNNYDSKNVSHGISELLYLFGNVLQQQNQIELSKLFVSLSDYLNPNFISNKLLNLENFMIEDSNYFNYEIADTIENLGSEFFWYINFNKLIHEEKKIQTKNASLINILKKKQADSNFFVFSKLIDLANYYRSNKNYKISLEYYERAEQIALPKELDWKFYYYKGICNERLGNFDNADKNFLKSLQLSPQEYVVINYLAYSWLERGVNIDRAKKMLYDAVELSKWEQGYIIDSLGWAYYLSSNFSEAEKLLQLAYEKAPYEPEVYDHYGDVLWKNNKKIQARYVWGNAIKLPQIDEERTKKLKEKLMHGIN